MSAKFSTYDYIGVIVPGSVFISINYLFLCLLPHKSSFNLAIGDFGLLLIFSFVVGHLLQGVGNIFEEFFWLVMGGWPTDQVLKSDNKLLSQNQLKALSLKIEEDFKIELLKVNLTEWKSIISQLKSRQTSEKLSIFNQNYGLLRGIATSLLLSMIIIPNCCNHNLATLYVLFGFILAMLRMYRFGTYYAKELFLNYLE